jgi:signal transduction histidine kinase
VPDVPHQRWHRRARFALKRSLRLRLLLVFLVLAMGMALIFILGTQRALGGGWRQAVAPLVADYIDRLASDIGSPPSVERAQALAGRLPISIRIEGPLVRWRSDAGASADKGRLSEFGQRWRDEEGPQLLARTTPDGHYITFGWADLPWKNQPRTIGWVTLGLLLLITALAYGYLRRLLRPLDDIRAGALRFGRGEFNVPIQVRRRDELGDLAQQVNTMAQDIDKMLQGQRALLLALSHELRSPLTRARLNAELLPENPASREPRDALLRDLAEMRDLIADLLESERLSGGKPALQREPTDLGALMEEVLRAHGDAARCEWHPAAAMPLVPVDRMRLRLALRNLVDNALRHGGDGGRVALSLEVAQGHARLVVRDHGSGVQESQLARLAEPFYRTDDARQRSTGGVGLGLYLARLVAQAHGGRLSFRNAAPGLEVTLLLPLRMP